MTKNSLSRGWLDGVYKRHEELKVLPVQIIEVKHKKAVTPEHEAENIALVIAAINR